MGILTGKKALILGVANERSIAWGITQALVSQGANVALSYLNDKLKERVIPLAESVGADFTFELDVTNENQVQSLSDIVKEHWGKVDVIVHSLAFADKDDLKAGFLQTKRDGFKLACDISAYSLVSVCHSLKEVMSDKCSVVSLTYHGSQQVVPG